MRIGRKKRFMVRFLRTWSTYIDWCVWDRETGQVVAASAQGHNTKMEARRIARSLNKADREGWYIAVDGKGWANMDADRP